MEEENKTTNQEPADEVKIEETQEITAENRSEKSGGNAYTDPITGRFKPGNPGKAKGTKNKKKLVDLITEEAIILAKEIGMKREEAEKAIAKKIAHIILVKGDTNIIKEYWQQRDGKPKQPLTGSEEGDEPLVVKIIRKDGDNDSV